ncbi:MAG TPA: ABC-type transport auxiliary lipoprotein family protein [Caulobacteraceae bacterium]|nr:ABC-type transport auxiliary lipoprotein family protein [Caulobacteraceae bacterium]
MRRRTLLLAAPAGLLAGCVSLFPKTPPVQLYRFGGDLSPAQQSPTAPNTTFAVAALPITFSDPAAGDQILTATGDEAAYIKGQRWVTSASSLFEQALVNAFGANPGPARLLSAGEPVPPDLYLKLDVRTFEARYLQGQGAAPTIEVAVDAALSVPAGNAVSAERLFSASVLADANRGSRIAAAFDQAVTQVLQALVNWVEAKGIG